MYTGKRIFDIIFSFLLLILVWPFLLLIACIIKIESRGPAIYKATRVGRFGLNFKMLKFRTMVVGSDSAGPNITLMNDARITKIGRFLRNTKLDELPSFLNVLRGDMSVVGHRPECPEWTMNYTTDEANVLLYRPGITGPSQIKFRNEEELISGENWQKQYLDIMKHKLSIDLEYLNTNSFIQDIKIIVNTIKVCFMKNSPHQHRPST